MRLQTSFKVHGLVINSNKFIPICSTPTPGWRTTVKASFTPGALYPRGNSPGTHWIRGWDELCESDDHVKYSCEEPNLD
jgi:hypothetical protein